MEVGLGQVAPAATADKRSDRSDRTGSFAVCEQLLAEGIRYVFGNPGTVEQGFLDALTSYPALQYVFAQIRRRKLIKMLEK